MAGEVTISGAAKQLAAPDADEAFLRHMVDMTARTMAQGREISRVGKILSGIKGLTRTSLDCAEELSALADIQSIIRRRRRNL